MQFRHIIRKRTKNLHLTKLIKILWKFVEKLVTLAPYYLDTHD